MKKQLIVLTLVALCFAFQGIAWAGSVEGTLNSVDSTNQTLAVQSAEGVQEVGYGDTTVWPADVTDPASLVGKTVTISTDDATGGAVSVQVS